MCEKCNTDTVYPLTLGENKGRWSCWCGAVKSDIRGVSK